MINIDIHKYADTYKKKTKI